MSPEKKSMVGSDGISYWKVHPFLGDMLLVFGRV